MSAPVKPEQVRGSGILNYMIVITATVASSATWFSAYPYTATITSPSTEINLLNNTAYGVLLIAHRAYLPLVMRNYLD